MKNKNIYLLIAGFLNLFTAFIHLIGGQITLLSPLRNSNLTTQVITEFLGVWHMATAVLFYTSILLIQKGFKANNVSKEVIHFMGILYILFGLSFVGASIYEMQLAPQWALLLPIGVLALIGKKRIV
jgi:hypothetical protein